MTDETPNNEATNNEGTAPEPTWWIDDKTPGSGDRPAWLESKFKNVAHLAESYKEMEKRVGYVPEEYDLSKSRYLDPDYVPFQELKELAKEKRVPQEVMDKMLESIDKYMDEFSINETEEVQKLGDNAKDRLTTLNNWAKANLSQESFEALTGSVRTAEALKALEELRGKMMENNTAVPNGNEDSQSNGVTLEQVQAELTTNLQKYKEDPKYRAELQQRMELASKGSSYVEKR
jgi:hypothetical protein